MPKYLVDIPDDSDTEYAYDQDTKELKFPSPRIDPTSFMGLEIVLTNVVPYEELDRKAIEDEVWEFVVKCLKMDGSDFYKIFDSCDVLCLTNLSYQEAKEKYDTWKAEKEEIRVGDEVDIDGEITVVTMINKYGEILSVDYGGMTYYYNVESQLKRAKKTGRHFDEVEDLLKKIGER